MSLKVELETEVGSLAHQVAALKMISSAISKLHDHFQYLDMTADEPGPNSTPHIISN